MRFTIAALAAAGTVAAFKNPLEPRSTITNHLFARQDVAVCASVDLAVTREDICTVAGVLPSQCTGTPTLANPVIPVLLNTVLDAVTPLLTPVITLCECATATALTPDSLVSFNNRYQSDIAGNTAVIGTINTALNQLLNGLNLQALLANGLIADINNTPAEDQCPVPPENAQPTCSADCGFTCDEGFISCDGETCITGSVCPSGTRRRRRAIANDLLCETGLTACAIPGNMYAFECLNTVTNVESCGGCIFALPGGKRGEDCTAKPGVLDVACIADKCVASSCTKGFVLNGTECVKPEAGSIVEDAKDLVGGVGRLFVNGAGNVVRRNAKEIIQARQATAELLKVKAARR